MRWTRSFSETTCRATGSSATCSGVASRSDDDADARGRGVARGPALGVAAVRQRPADAGVDHRRRPGPRGAATRSTSASRQSMSSGSRGLPERRHHLIHEAARHAGRALLGAPAGLREHRRLEREPGDPAEREPERDRERAARRQPGAHRDARGHGGVHAGGLAPLLRQRRRGAPRSTARCRPARRATTTLTSPSPRAGGIRPGSRARAPSAAPSRRCSRCARRSG